MPSEDFEQKFAEAKSRALDYIGAYNAKLPSKACPECNDDGHVPGLRCPCCGYRHPRAWAILRDTEFGYDVVLLTNRKQILASFDVNDPD